MKKIMSLLGLLALLLVVAPAVGSSKKYEAPKRAEALASAIADEATGAKVIMDMDDVTEGTEGKEEKKIEQLAGEVVHAADVKVSGEEKEASAEALNKRGVSLWEKDPLQAVKLYRAAAARGSAAAMYNLGVFLQHGGGTEKDKKQAVEWYQKAANLGDADAMANLGVCLEEGIGVDQKDEKQAVEWFEKAANLGNANAMYNLWSCLRKGVAVDLLAAADWLAKAVEKGYAPAQAWLGWLLLTGKDGFAVDVRMAVAHFNNAAQQNDCKGLLYLGYCRQKGIGIAIDTKEAVALFNRAGELEQKAAVDAWRKQTNAARLGLIDGQPFSCFNKECSICSNRLVSGQLILRLDCCHGFHPQCLEPWLKQQQAAWEKRRKEQADAGEELEQTLPQTCPECRGDASHPLRGVAL